MNNAEMLDDIMKVSIENWNKHFGGISAATVAQKLDSTNEEIMKHMETLVAQGRGNINKNRELCEITINAGDQPKFSPFISHIFFPRKQELEEYYYSSLAKSGPPPYRKELFCGEHQLKLFFFTHSVLDKYLAAPEKYKVNDSLSGGEFHTSEDAEDEEWVYIRYGKRKLEDKSTAVCVILKDLDSLPPKQQHHWAAHNIDDAEGGPDDQNFEKFFNRTYEGKFEDFEDPLKEALSVLVAINDAAEQKLYKELENRHLRIPVKETFKDFCDCCSELYKLVGPDNLKRTNLIRFLSDRLGVEESEILHTDSGRPFSQIQCLTLLEERLGISHDFTKAIKDVKKFRISADHKILEPQDLQDNLVDCFLEKCKNITHSGTALAKAISKIG